MKDVQSPRFGFLTAIQRRSSLANGVLLAAFLVWVLFFDSSRTTISNIDMFNGQGSSEPANENIHWLVYVGAALVATAFFTQFMGLWRGQHESRSVKAWLILISLVCAWLAVWIGKQDLYWYGHAMRVSSEVNAATQLAHALDKNWPSGDGDYPELGVVLGYPKNQPVSLILAGEPVAVGRLRIVAIEKSQDGRTIRFQLANPNHDTWLVRGHDGTGITEFVNGFDTRYVAKRSRRLSPKWFLVRYGS